MTRRWQHCSAMFALHSVAGECLQCIKGKVKCVSPQCKQYFCVFHYCTDDVSISGFKDAISEQSATESAAEAATGHEQEGGVSPDTVSATSQSTDDPTKDIVSC